VRAAVLTGDRGDGGAPIKFAKGGTVVGALNSIRASTGGGGAHGRVGVRRGGRAWKKSKGRRGGLVASRAVGGEWLSMWRGGKDWGPGQRHEV
jgi:hypothetical protein